MPYSYVLTTTIPASPEEIYEAWLDSLGHSQMTGAQATMSDEIGAEVSAWDGYISGRNLELVPGERIVQSWRTSEFGEEHGDSIITLVLEGVDEGTLLTLEHSNVPDEQRSYEEGGWLENYFEPMAVYFTERKKKAAPSEEAVRHRGSAPRPAAKSPAKPKRAASAKAKRAAPRAKPSPRKSKRKAKALSRKAAAASRKRAKPGARKSTPARRRGKRK